MATAAFIIILVLGLLNLVTAGIAADKSPGKALAAVLFGVAFTAFSIIGLVRG